VIETEVENDFDDLKELIKEEIEINIIFINFT
jgi:hypothetical protein